MDPKRLDQEPEALQLEKDERAARAGAGHDKDQAELAKEQPAMQPRGPRPRDPSAPDRGPGRAHSRNLARRAAEHSANPNRAPGRGH